MSQGELACLHVFKPTYATTTMCYLATRIANLQVLYRYMQIVTYTSLAAVCS